MLLTFYNEQIKTLISDGAFEPLLYLVTSNNINYTIVILYSIELNNWDILYISLVILDYMRHIINGY